MLTNIIIGFKENMNIYNPNGVNLTGTAIDYLINITKTNYVLLSINKSGCSGFKYALTEVKHEDYLKNKEKYEIYKFKNIAIIVKTDQINEIKGIEIDYLKVGVNNEISFKNSNTENECGCGESFSLKNENNK
jgi:iron-sulfur cluster assembly protein